MEDYPDYNDDGEIQKLDKFTWIIELKKFFDFLKNNIFDFVVTPEISNILNLCSKFGGLALRTINPLLATATISFIHKVTRKVWNDMDTIITYFTNNYFRYKTVKVINHIIN